MSSAIPNSDSLPRERPMPSKAFGYDVELIGIRKMSGCKQFSQASRMVSSIIPPRKAGKSIAR